MAFFSEQGINRRTLVSKMVHQVTIVVAKTRKTCNSLMLVGKSYTIIASFFLESVFTGPLGMMYPEYFNLVRPNIFSWLLKKGIRSKFGQNHSICWRFSKL